MPILEPHTHNILCGTDVTALVADSDPRFDLICLEVAAGEVKDLGLSDAGHLSVTLIAGLPHRYTANMNSLYKIPHHVILALRH